MVAGRNPAPLVPAPGRARFLPNQGLGFRV